MFNNETLKVLTDIRVDLLRYWSTEKDQSLKDQLSDHMNKLDQLILIKKKQLETLQKI